MREGECPAVAGEAGVRTARQAISSSSVNQSVSQSTATKLIAAFMLIHRHVIRHVTRAD